MSTPLKFYTVLYPILAVAASNAYSQLTADFNIVRESKCAPSIVTFVNHSSEGPGITYKWDLGKGTVIASDKKELKEVYPSPGNYNIILYVIQGTDTVTKTATLQVANGPEAGFRVNNTAGCVPFNAVFTDMSVQGDAAITEWSWDLRNGTVLNSQYPAYTYINPGSYDVLLKVTDLNGCSDFIESQNLIDVHSLPEAGFSVETATACNPPLQVQFVDQTQSETAAVYEWDFGNGITSHARDTTIVYNETGSYNVSLYVTDSHGCADSLTKNSFITIGNPPFDFVIAQKNNIFENNYDTICPGNFTLTPSESTFENLYWNIAGAGFDTSLIFNGALPMSMIDSGLFSVELTAGYGTGCPDTVKKIFFADYVKADFTLDNYYFCKLPETITIADYSENAVFRSWRFPDDTIPGGTNFSYELKYPEGYNGNNTASVQEIDYTIGLLVTNPNGCNALAQKTVEVKLPAAYFVSDKTEGCVPLKINFTDKSKSVEDINTWTYYISNGDTIARQEPLTDYTFNTPGKYEIRMTIENEAGCTDTSNTIKIEAGDKVKPDFSISPDSACSQGKIEIEYLTPFADSIDNWEYSSPAFGIVSGAEKDPKIDLDASQLGYANIELSVKYNGCISDTTMENILYILAPIGRFSHDYTCEDPELYTFNIEEDSATSWTLTTEGTDYDNLLTVNHRYSSYSQQTVTLTSRNSHTGCEHIRKGNVAVTLTNAVFLSDSTTCAGERTIFDAGNSISSSVNNQITDFIWDYGDNTPAESGSDSYPYHIYQAKGDFIVKLVIKGTDGCKDSVTGKITVSQPHASFTVDNDFGCAPGMNVNFTNTSTDTTIDAFRWIFGDGSFDGSQSNAINHDYTSPETRDFYSGILAKDINGCYSSVYKMITIFRPDAYFQAQDNSVCLGDNVTFIRNDQSADVFEWDFGDGTTSQMVSTHLYDSAGLYDVMLTVAKNGCSTSYTRPDYVLVDDASAAYTYTYDTNECYPFTVEFTHNGNEVSIAEGLWTFDANHFSLGYNPVNSYTYSRPGTYNTSLWIRTVNGCSATESNSIVIKGPYAGFSFSPQTICYGDEVNFHITDTMNLRNFRWYFGDGEISDVENPAHSYSLSGSVTPSLWISNDICSGVVTGDSIQVVETVADFETEKENYCTNENLRFHNLSQSASGFTWSLDDNTISYSFTPVTLSFTTPQVYNIKLTAVNSLGCSDTVVKAVSVAASPALSVDDDKSICRDAESTIIASSDPGTTIQWYPSTGLDNSTSFSPVANPAVTTTYIATVTSPDGCTAQDSVTINIIEPVTVTKSPESGISIEIGQSVPLMVTASGEAEFSWSPDYNITCTNCPNPLVRPFENTVYTVTVKDQCTEQAVTFDVEVIKDYTLVVPDAFTPNNDGNNDILYVRGKKIKELIEFKIYNRWGNLIFNTDDINTGWDGYYEGRKQKTDTYTYFVRALTIYDYEVFIKGTFLLID